VSSGAAAATYSVAPAASTCRATNPSILVKPLVPPNYALRLLFTAMLCVLADLQKWQGRDAYVGTRRAELPAPETEAKNNRTV
jgi:hypothetical protein